MINSQMANCLWNDFEGHKNIHLALWQLVCMKQEFGGLGIPNLHNLNICLLGSWIKRYMAGEGKIWRSIVDTWFSSPNIICSDSVGASTFLKGVMWAAKAVKFGSRWAVGDGKNIRFWEDTWFGSSPLTVQYWDLYCICREQCNTIQQVWDGHSIKLSFRRVFHDNLMNPWFELDCQKLLSLQMTVTLIWQYERSRQYSSSSLYSTTKY